MQQAILKQLKALPIIPNYYLTGGTGGGGTITGGTNGLGVEGKNIILGGVINQTTNISLGSGTGYTRINFNHTDNNIAIEYSTEIDYDLPFNGAKIGVDSDGVFIAQNNYQTPQRGSVPYIRDEDGHIAFQGLAENEVYTVDASGNPTTIGLGNLDPWLLGGDFTSQGNISIQGGDLGEFGINFNVESFNVQGITNVGLQSGGVLSLQANEAGIYVDERVIINTSLYNAGIIVGSVDGDSTGIQLQLGDNVTAPETGALFIQNDLGVLNALNPTIDGDVLKLVDGLPSWVTPASAGITASNGLTINEENDIQLGGDFVGANLTNLSGDGVFQINIGEETTDRHSLYYDVGQFYLQFIGLDTSTRNYNLSSDFSADGFENLIFIALNNVQISNSTGYFSLNDGLTIASTNDIADVITSLNLSETDITLTDNRSVKKGIEYAGTYESGFTDSSLITKRYFNQNLNIVKQRTVTGTSYTLQSTDLGYILYFTNISAISVTLPSGLTSGHQTIFIKYGGNITFTAQSGSTMRTIDNATKITNANASASFVKNGSYWQGFGLLTV